MITVEELEKLARLNQTGVFPNVVREYFQNLFLGELYRLPGSERMLFKGGTALRIIYGSPRFSEDLDFSLFGAGAVKTKSFVEGLFVKTLTEVERIGIEIDIGAKSNLTSGGYFGAASFKMPSFQPLGIEINVSVRQGRHLRGEPDTVANNFIPAYTLTHLPQKDLVNEKIFGALRERKKPRDFYDLYFMMRKGMLSQDQKKRLAGMKDDILADAKNMNFKRELGVFLPADQQVIIRDFSRVLKAELSRQTGE